MFRFRAGVKATEIQIYTQMVLDSYIDPNESVEDRIAYCKYLRCEGLILIRAAACSGRLSRAREPQRWAETESDLDFGALHMMTPNHNQTQ